MGVGRRPNIVTVLILCHLLITRPMKLPSEDLADSLDDLLTQRVYDARIRPNYYQNQHEEVEIRFHIIAADNININRMAFQTEADLHLKWVDHRLTHSYPYTLHVDYNESQLWIPDIYIVNALKTDFHMTTEYNKCIQIHGDGTVEYKIRLTVLARCNIDLHMFPWDVQVCPIILQSYSHSVASIRCSWAQHKDNATRFIAGLHKRPMSQYEFIEYDLLNENLMYNQPGKTGNWSTLTATLAFKRLNGFYLMEILLPANIIIALSWVSFIIDARHAPARVFLGTTCILSMSSMMHFLNNSLPKVSYMKIIDYYLLFGNLFVTLAMLEYAVVLLMLERIKKAHFFKEEGKLSRQHQFQTSMYKCWSQIKLCFHGNPFCWPVRPTTPVLCDRVSTYLFPAVYILFNIIFWAIVYTETQKQHNHDDFSDMVT